jgi:hypothetical protein
VKKAFDLDAAIADPQRIMVPITKDQRQNLRYWDFYLHDLQVRIDRQAAKKAAANE